MASWWSWTIQWISLYRLSSPFSRSFFFISPPLFFPVLLSRRSDPKATVRSLQRTDQRWPRGGVAVFCGFRCTDYPHPFQDDSFFLFSLSLLFGSAGSVARHLDNVDYPQSFHGNSYLISTLLFFASDASVDSQSIRRSHFRMPSQASLAALAADQRMR